MKFLLEFSGDPLKHGGTLSRLVGWSIYPADGRLKATEYRDMRSLQVD